jgi:hypothetical protein
MSGIGAASVPASAKGGGGVWQANTHTHCENCQAHSKAAVAAAAAHIRLSYTAAGSPLAGQQQQRACTLHQR